MAATASVRDLRNRFPRVRKLIEADGEVLLSERGKTKYRLSLQSPRPATAPCKVDYWARLTLYQPTAFTASEAQALRDENRGDR